MGLPAPPAPRYRRCMDSPVDGQQWIVSSSSRMSGCAMAPDRKRLPTCSFTLFSGQFYFLTGPSGAGKSSLLRMLYLAQRPSRGMIRLFDSAIW